MLPDSQDWIMTVDVQVCTPAAYCICCLNFRGCGLGSLECANILALELVCWIGVVVQLDELVFVILARARTELIC